MSIPYEWLKSVNPALLQEDEIPLFGESPPFPWEAFSNHLAKTLDLVSLTIKPIDVRWRDPKESTEGLGDPLPPLAFSVSTLEGSLQWLMGEEDLNTLFHWLTTQGIETAAPIRPDPDLREGFYHFLAAEVIHAFSQVPFDNALNIHLLNEASPLTETALCLDVQIAYKNHSKAFGRLVISSDFRRSWKERYAERKLTTSLSSPLAEKLPVTLRLVGGKASLPLEEWRKVSCGDFLLLDECSIEPGAEKHRIWIFLNESPLFRARIKPGNLKILESPLYHEVHMATEHSDNVNGEDEDLEFEEQDLEVEEELASDFENDEEEASEEIEEEYSEEHSPQPKEKAAASLKEGASQEPSAHRAPLSPKDLNVHLVIEVGRLQISMQKLLDLQPGNTLDLDIRPENGVDLVVDGKCIGKGELLRMGETLGVRILDLG